MFRMPLIGWMAAVILCSPALAQEKAPDPGIYELRVYHVAPGKLDALQARFRDHTTRLFEKHGMTQVGYWVPVDPKEGTLVFLLAYPDREARDASWQAFVEDEDWKKALAESEKDGKLVTKVDQSFLAPTSYSPGFGKAAEGTSRLFEMRTYSSSKGNLPALHKRFSDHTIQLFAKHGMSNLGYFQPVAGQPGASETLLYFLAHQDAATAARSWDAFRSDPVWVAAKKATEEAAGGSLTIPDGVKSLMLQATDFSPLK